MSDITCMVCGEPWDAYGARHGDMAPWEYGLFRQGAGCPACEGETPEGADEGATIEHAIRGQIFTPTDDDDLINNFAAIAEGAERPNWVRPSDPVVWSCAGCDAHVVRDLDTNELEWRKLGVGLYNLPAGVDADDAPDAAPYTVDGKGYCGCCATTCDECSAHVFTSSTSCNGSVLYGDTYDAGSSFPSPHSHHETVCVDCLEATPSCAECGEYYRDADDAEACCAPEDDSDDDE